MFQVNEFDPSIKSVVQVLKMLFTNEGRCEKKETGYISDGLTSEKVEIGIKVGQGDMCDLCCF